MSVWMGSKENDANEFFLVPLTVSEVMGSSMVDLNLGGWTQRRVNAVLHQMLGGRTPQVNDQDQIIQSGNYCYLSLRMASIDEVKYDHQMITMDLT